MKNLFNDKEFWKTAVRLTIPVALQNLLTSSFVLARYASCKQSRYSGSVFSGYDGAVGTFL